MIIAIDPGNEQSAYVMVNDDLSIVAAHKVPNLDLLHMMCFRTFAKHNVRTICIESIQSYGMAVGRSVFETCMWIGRFEQKARDTDSGITIKKYARPAIFRGVVGQSKGGDAAMRQALLTRFGGDKKGEPMNVLKGGGSDKRSAFAVAVYHLDGAKLGEW